MKRLVFGIAVAATILTAPLAHAQPDVQGQCASSGGQYTSQEVSPHFGSPPSLIETCCVAQKCTTYRDGVHGPTYGGEGSRRLATRRSRLPLPRCAPSLW
jgi:hypothetical protein